MTLYVLKQDDKDPAAKTGYLGNPISSEKVPSANFVREFFGHELRAHMPKRKETFVTPMQTFELRVGPYTMFVRILVSTGLKLFCIFQVSLKLERK